MSDLIIINSILENLSLEERSNMGENHNQHFRLVNEPPIFTGKHGDLDGFLTRAELTMESNPERFREDENKIRFLMSYMFGKALEWASVLRRNNSPLLNDYDGFVRELRSNFGDYTTEAVVANERLCNLRQKRFGHVFEYITEFQRIGQSSNFNESAKIHMFIRGLKQQLREKIAVVDPNPISLERLFRTVVTVENLIKRNDTLETYYQHQTSNDPMDIDLYRIKKDPRTLHYYQPYKNPYKEENKTFEEERKKGVCFYCKQKGHMKFNCPNKKRPKQMKIIKRTLRERGIEPGATVGLHKSDKGKAVVEEERSNVIDFYISTNEVNEQKARVLIDSGADLNFIHPEFAKLIGINVNQLKEPFGVSGLGYGISKVRKETEKCILRKRNHYELIKFYVLRIPDVDIILGLPWIEKHCPSNYHDNKKLAFSSGFCARFCNYGKRKRNLKKEKKPVIKIISRKGKEPAEDDHERSKIKKKINEEPSTSRANWSSEDEEEKEEYFKGRLVHTINDSDVDYDSDINDSFMFDSDSDSISDSISDSDNVSDSNNNEIKDENNPCNKNKCNNESCNEHSCSRKESKIVYACRVIKKLNILNKDEKMVTVPSQYMDFIDVFNEQNCKKLPPHRDYDCEIKLKENSSLFYGPLYSLNEVEREELKRYLKENLEKGFIRKSTSPAGAPILFVKKKDGSLRLCVDYRKLNEMTIRNSYPLPLISDLLDRVKGAKIFTKLDLKSAYNLVRIKEGDEFKTAFRTRYGHYEYLVMPFGLKNAPATFQHFINDVLSDYLDEFVISYIDDILIYSKDIKEHHTHVTKVLIRLLENNLYLNLEKCEFDVEETTFLGYVISKRGLEMDKDKVKAVLDWPIPKNVKEIQSFIGLCNYYRIFIKDFAKIANPLHKLTRKNVPYIWSDEQQNAFDTLKNLFTSAPILKHPDSNQQFIVETDASNFAIGAILSQEFDGKLHPIAFFQKVLLNLKEIIQFMTKNYLQLRLL